MAQAIDPVCGMTVDSDTAQYKSDYQGTTYYFCASGCKSSFDKNPTEFVGQQGGGSGGSSGGSQGGSQGGHHQH